MQKKYKHLFWIFALIAGFTFDLLFWEKPFGINYFIFILLILLGGLLPIWLEKIPVPWTSYLLLIPIGVFALMTFIRAEPLTTVANGLITLGGLTLFSMTLLNGAWYQFRIRDHLANLFVFLFNCIVGGIFFFTKFRNVSAPTQSEPSVSSEGLKTANIDRKHFFKKAAPYLRGILLTLPVLVILASLLASADAVFNTRIQNFFKWLEFDNQGELIFRLFYIVVLSYLILSAYHYGLVESKKWDKNTLEQGQPQSFLGSVEATIMLGAVNLLFLVFVILQFTYLFGGQTNITNEGFTYAEYARRGFSELIVVALISLLVFYTLSMVTKRENKAKRCVFSILGLLLVGFVGIILASAFKRLTLYEAAYGFTRLRTLTHIFIIWIGLFLASTAILEITKKMDRLALILICFVLGFGLTINLLNVDRFIVQQNISRSMNALEENTLAELDTGYLFSLSFDSIQPLVKFFNDPETPEVLRDDIGGVLACQSAALDNPQTTPWTSWHLANSRGVELLKEQSNALETYPVSNDQGLFVEVNGDVRPCYGNAFDTFD